jgi:hypothetical protein
MALPLLAMTVLPASATARSHELLALAAGLAERWPVAWAADIGVAGSVARGTADGASDVELSFWLDAPIAEAEVDEWLASLGVEEVHTPPFTSGWPVFRQFRWQGAWFDGGWHTVAEQQGELDRALEGGQMHPNLLVTPGIVATLVPLRDRGNLARWREQAAVFPEAVAEPVIANAIAFWEMAHWVESRWTLAARGQRMALAAFLRVDAEGVLRLLFAHHRVWFADWKWLPAVCGGLPSAPPDLAARLEAVFAEPDGTKAVRDCYTLVAEALVLVVDARPEVGVALGTMRESLRRHGPSPP